MTKRQQAIFTGEGALKGKRALIMPGPGTKFNAQFNDISTGFGFNWHEFESSDFDVEAEVDFSDVDKVRAEEMEKSATIKHDADALRHRFKQGALNDLDALEEDWEDDDEDFDDWDDDYLDDWDEEDDYLDE